MQYVFLRHTVELCKGSEEEIRFWLTCLQWFSNTMRQVSGSAVQGLEGAALRPVRPPGPRGFSLLNQLILDPGERQFQGLKDSITREGVPVEKEKKVKVERKQEARKITEEREGEDAVGGGGGEEEEEKRGVGGREYPSRGGGGGEGGWQQTRCHSVRICMTLSSL